MTIEDLATLQKNKKERNKTKMIIKHLVQRKNTIIAHLATERSLMQSGSSSCPYVDVQSDSQQLLNHSEVLTRNFEFGDKG